MNLTETQSDSLFFEALRSRVNITRDEALEDIDNQLTKSARFVALRGHNGSGKSYFLHNQLLPFYTNNAERKVGEAEGPWRVKAFTPQVNPIGTLASALASPGILQENHVVQPFFRDQLEQQLRSGNDGLVNIRRSLTFRSTLFF